MSKILIVDDDNDFLQACEAVLLQEGYEVQKASCVAEAERVISKTKFNLVLLDVMMENPDDGISLAHKLKKTNADIPILMLSGVSKITGYEYKCSDMLPCLDFIEKPITPDLLLKKVKEALAK
ncbi:MAG TPA: response regulator [Candidatus Omnitrophota bacterium]|nr:response regulator [Candidatus Omnitrophota bacterium]HQO58884.1 response regulator [Candidatus Omnitrophota bacterium]HQP11689.1 response regulator [Candidatus Omnitrophota bacterium]